MVSDDNVSNPGEDATLLDTNNSGNEDENEAPANGAEAVAGSAPSPVLKTVRAYRVETNRSSRVVSFGHGLRVSVPTTTFDRNTTATTDENTPLNQPKRLHPQGQFNRLTRLQLDLDTNRQMHRLAGIFFDQQHFWLLFLPSISITTVSGILAFLSDNPSFLKWNSFFALFVGSLSMVSIFLQAMIKELDFGHRAKMHRNVAMDLGIMQDSLAFDQLNVWDDEAQLNELIRSNKDRFTQVIQSCKSSLPTEIYNAYELASTRMALSFMPPVRLNEDDGYCKSKVEWISFMEIVNNEIFNSFITSPLWPLAMPNAQLVIQTTQKRLVDLLKKNQPSRGDRPINMYELLLQQQENIRSINRDHTTSDYTPTSVFSGDVDAGFPNSASAVSTSA